MVVMGQRYLPKHIELASGVTLGGAVAIGGVAPPMLGWVADFLGIRTALMGLLFLPVLKMNMGTGLTNLNNLATLGEGLCGAGGEWRLRMGSGVGPNKLLK
jgi:hypothetical protein